MATQGLRIVGIMSHFPVEDVADVRQSLGRFIEESDWVIAAGGLDRTRIQRHVANTYATFHVPEARLDMVRVGGGLVGDGYPGFEQFKRIMTAKSRVATINFYPAGSSVNYDRTYRLSRDSWLANVPIGYADGYRRAFSFRNSPQPDKLQTHALIGGRRAPVLGRVTMNTIMLDVTDFRDAVRMDDEVVFFGRQGDQQITAQELEAAAATLNTEVYLIFANSMPRVLKPR
jgi:alanine racemase